MRKGVGGKGAESVLARSAQRPERHSCPQARPQDPQDGRRLIVARSRESADSGLWMLGWNAQCRACDLPRLFVYAPGVASDSRYEAGRLFPRKGAGLAAWKSRA